MDNLIKQLMNTKINDIEKIESILKQIKEVTNEN